MFDQEKGKSQWAKWWLSAGCFGLILTVTFIAVTLYLGVGQQPPRITEQQRREEFPTDAFVIKQSNKKAVIEMISLEEAKPSSRSEEVPRISPKFMRIPIKNDPPPSFREEDFKIPPVNLKPLHTQPTRETLEEMFSGPHYKEGETKKKSEAVYPGWTDPDAVRRPMVVDPENHFKRDSGFRLPGLDPDNSPAFSDQREVVHEDLMDYYYGDSNEGSQEVEENFFSYLQNVLKSALGDKQVLNSEWLDVLDAVNESIARRNISVVMTKLKDMYYNESDKDIAVSSLIYPSKASVSNTSSLVSFGLLAIDLFLLHNVQQIAWAEEKSLGEKMLQDPEVVAMNALFLAPDKVRQLKDGGDSRLLDQNQSKGVFEELMDFITGAVRAVTNLSKAYKSSTETVVPRSGEPSALDCLWTIYCRNLDKTAKLSGPYGFLAKMNSLGLRLMMGEFPIERAMDRLMTEATRGFSPIDCPKLFPRCSAEEARSVVLATALGDNL